MPKGTNSKIGINVCKIAKCFNLNLNQTEKYLITYLISSCTFQII